MYIFVRTDLSDRSAIQQTVVPSRGQGAPQPHSGPIVQTHRGGMRESLLVKKALIVRAGFWKILLCFYKFLTLSSHLQLKSIHKNGLSSLS